MITKNELTAEDVRQTAEQVLRDHLNVNIDGYKWDTARVLNVLMKAAIDGQSVERACADLNEIAGSNALREQLNVALDVYDLRRHEIEMNAGLAACFPADLPRMGREMALDLHDEPFYGKTPELRMYACRGEAKDGTTYFYRVASVYVMWRQVRVTLAVTYVLPEDSNLSVVQHLIQRMQHLGFRPSVLYADKEFCEGPIIAYLHQEGLPAVLACSIRGKTGGTRALCHGRHSYCTTYTFTDGTTARLAIVATLKVDKKTGKRRRTWLVFVLVHLDWSASKTRQRYRRRFGIESSYRQFGAWRARTTSRHPAFRFFLLGLAFWLLNIWVRLRYLATRLIAVGPARLVPDAFRLHRYIAFLRRAIELAFGAPMAIPIYSW
jgi:putative transposase